MDKELLLQGSFDLLCKLDLEKKAECRNVGWEEELETAHNVVPDPQM